MTVKRSTRHLDRTAEGPPVYRISALTSAGTVRLTQDLMKRLEELAPVGTPLGATDLQADGVENDGGDRA